MFFKDLTESNLQLESYKKIKHIDDKSFAMYIATLSTKEFTVDGINILNKKTKKKYVLLEKNDRLGIVVILLLLKENGYIQVSLRRKRSADINVEFYDLEWNHLDKFYFKYDCNVLWIKTLLFEFDIGLVSYVKNGLSSKLKDIHKFIKQFLVNKNFGLKVHIDIPGYVCVI